MMRPGWIGFAVVGLALAGCDRREESAPAPVTKIEIANPYHERLMGLSVINRSLGLRRAIQDAGERCTRITRSGYQEPYRKLQMWVARCEPEGDFAIYIAATGDAQVRRCAQAATLKLPACRTEGLDAVPRITAGEKLPSN